MSSDPEDPPPGYNDLLPMIGVKPRSRSPFEAELHPLVGPAPAASAPFLASDVNSNPGIPTLNRVMEDIPNTISLKDGPRSSTLDREEFFIRDSVESLLVKGVVRKTAGQSKGVKLIGMQSVDGEVFLVICFEAGKIGVRHRNIYIGGVKMSGTPKSVGLTKSYENRDYSVNHLSANDIVISRKDSVGHICKLHIPGPNANRFDCTVVFSERNGVTAIEKCLCLSVALVFMTARNDISTEAAESSQNNAAVMLCLFCVAVVIGIVILVVVVMNASAEQQKRRAKYG